MYINIMLMVVVSCSVPVVLLDTTSVLGELGWKTYPVNGVSVCVLACAHVRVLALGRSTKNDRHRSLVADILLISFSTISSTREMWSLK